MELNVDDIRKLSSRIGSGFKRFQFGTKSQLAFIEDLYVLINDGIPANRAVDMMSHISTGINKDVALSISQKISEGQPLAEGMRPWFSPNIVEIIRVGEEGGALAETMRSAIKTLSQRTGTIGALISAVAYPLMVIAIAAFVIVYLNNTVLVQFKTIKPMDQWPDAGRQLVHTAQIVESWWWAVILILVAIVLVFRKILSNYTGDLRSSLDSMPPFSLYRRVMAARFMETLGLLIVNGVVFKNALRVIQYQANPYLVSHLIVMEHLLSMGKGNVADVLDTGLIDKADILRLRVMGEVKGFEHGLVRMGIRGAEQSTKTMRLIARIVGGLLLAVGAFLIVTIIRGIYLTGMTLGGG